VSENKSQRPVHDWLPVAFVSGPQTKMFFGSAGLSRLMVGYRERILSCQAQASITS
jgi:hypothetical protein